MEASESQERMPRGPIRALARLLGIEPGEFAAVAWSFVYFFCILAGYFMLRSVRESMAIVSGVQNIPWLFTGTFTLMMLATPAFGWVTSRFPRRIFLPWIYYFFIINILLFYAAFTYAQANGLSLVWISRAFFVWLSVFNLFVVSVFWSFMADIYNKAQTRRLFGVISAGGSMGALIGPLVTSVLVTRIGFQNLLPITAVLLLFAVYCVYRLRHWVIDREVHGQMTQQTGDSHRPMGGSIWAGVRFVVTTPYFAAIAAALACANFLGGAIYMYMAQLVSVTFEGSDRHTQVFAIMDALINGFSLIGQLLLVKHAVRKLGIGGTLALLPLVSLLGFALLAINPVFVVIAVLQVLRRSLGFGFSKPTNDMLYGVVSKEAKYKAKNFIDTAVYRGWDVVATWTIRSMSGIGLSGVALVCIPIAAIWTWLVLWIGREYNRRDRETTINA
jgi:AAA family ATP:ADP antiporter